MLHDQLTVSASSAETIIEQFLQEFDCHRSETEHGTILLNNDSISLHASVTPRLDDQALLVIDYPEDLKPRLEKALDQTLTGQRRLPTLVEFAKELLAITKKRESFTTEELRRHFGLTDIEFTQLLDDFQASAAKRRAHPLVKKAWTAYQDHVTDIS